MSDSEIKHVLELMDKIDRLQAVGDALAEMIESEIGCLTEAADTHSNIFAAPMHKKAQSLEQLLTAWNKAKEQA